jgi:hypothetical protein
MAIILWNVTNEDMGYQYGGLSYTVEAGKRKKVNDQEGNHVLNALGPRGMTQLLYDDDGKLVDEEKIQADALERYKDFKVRQIVIYNERNERRKASGQPYDVPTDTVKKYAAEMGIALLQPYALADAEKGQIGILTFENKQLKAQIEEIIKQMAKNAAQGQPAEVKIPEGSVKCDVCGDIVLEKRFKSHLNYKHNIKDEGTG